MRKFLDTITRTCYQSNDTVCAIQKIQISVDYINTVDGAGRAFGTMESDNNFPNRFKFRSNAKIVSNTVLHTSKGAGGDKTVAYVITEGKFTSHDHAGTGGDIATVTYALPEGDLVIDLTTIDEILIEGAVF